MSSENHLPLKSQQQTFSNDFVRAYFLRSFFGRIEQNDTTWAIFSSWEYDNRAIAPNQVFNDSMPPTMKRIANAYADMMMRLYESGWVIIGNNIFTTMGNLRSRSASQTFLEGDEETWLSRWATNGRLRDGLNVLTFLFPPPSILRGIDYGSLGSDNLIDGGVLFAGQYEQSSSEEWRFAIKIDDTYSVIFDMGEWSNNYGYRPTIFELIKSSNITIMEELKSADSDLGWMVNSESLRIVVDNEDGVWTTPIEFCIPYQSANSSIKTLNFSRSGFV